MACYKIFYAKFKVTFKDVFFKKSPPSKSIITKWHLNHCDKYKNSQIRGRWTSVNHVVMKNHYLILNRSRTLPGHNPRQTGGDDAELALRELVADGPGDAPCMLPTAAAQVVSPEPHARFPAHGQVADAGNTHGVLYH